MPIVGKIIKSKLAVLRGYKSCSINADYRNMTKFAGDINNGFVLVRATLNS
ncbi:uncharacterized protein K441DRAFT_557861 [Cenococcum geophilum 1.58]|uniref:uncharacterized protein n=1 Tax=Cenococcum geophilum 1.58 TaxID=794803 RepID=UPI00358FB1A3|nr:hypothetical protein K441DRAFT_557861 [Cenococcum geophilum 1.58]